MILRSARIRNFRSLRDIGVDFGRQTVLVGGNGAGKSSVLRAIELFYAPNLGQVRPADFFDPTAPIEIELTFTAFTEAERELFSSRISGDEMSVVRVIENGGGKNSGSFFGTTLVHAPFVALGQLDGIQRRTEFNSLPREGIYADLPKVSKVGEIDGAVAEWVANHPGECVSGRDDGQFLGFKNVGRGQLQKATNFVLIPAVRDAAGDAQDAKNTVIGQLLELIVRSAIQSRKDVQAFQKRISEEYATLTDPANLPELGGLADGISQTLGQLYSDVAVALNWKAPDAFAVPLPGADVALKDDEIEVPVDRAGHGLQRAFIIALLQHLARARAKEPKAESNDVPEDDSQPIEDTGQQPLPGLILAIEEPELYQHPTKQRHFAKVLSRLSQGLLPGMATMTQMIFATHSPHFVAMDRFDEIRIMRRTRNDPDLARESICSSATLAGIASVLETAADRPEGTFTAQSLKPRLHIINSELAEGFFAKAVVLVEGVSDRAALAAAASLAGRDFEEEGIAVLPVGGKDNIDKPWAIFSAFGIPVFAIWDSDHGKPSPKAVACNRLLQRLVSASEPHDDYPAFVAASFACFRDTLEVTLRSELGDDVLDGLLDAMTTAYDLPKREDATKSPSVMSEVLKKASETGKVSQTLAAIVDAIFELTSHQ